MVSPRLFGLLNSCAAVFAISRMVRLEAEFGKPVVTNKISTVWHIRTTVKQLTTQTRIRSFDDGKQMRLQSLD